MNKTFCSELKSRLLPKLTKRIIRRTKIPLYLALQNELNEDGFWKYSDIWTEAVNKCDQLKKSKNLLMTLHRGFINANTFYNKGHYHDEITELLVLAIIFQKLDIVVSNFIYKKLQVISEDCDREDLLAAFNLIYGYFLFKINLQYYEAIEYLETSKKYADNKSWEFMRIFAFCHINSRSIIEEYTKKMQPNLYSESCLLLSQIYLKLKNQDETYYRKAYNNAILSNHEETIVTTSKIVGQFLLKEKKFSSALFKFRKLLDICIKANNLNGICEAHLLLFSVYIQLEDQENYSKHLRSLKKLTSSQQNNEYLAQAFNILGQHYVITNGPSQIALNYLEKALNVLKNKTDKQPDINLIECIHCIGFVKAEESLDEYITNCLLNSGRNDTICL